MFVKTMYEQRAERHERVHRVELIDRALAHQAAVRVPPAPRRGSRRRECRKRKDAKGDETEQSASGHGISCSTGQLGGGLPSGR